MFFGYRSWTLVVDYKGEPRLASIIPDSEGKTTLWTPEMKAECSGKTTVVKGGKPALIWGEELADYHLKLGVHTCGLYSYKSLESVPTFLYAFGIHGVTINYGTVFEHTEGYKASRAIISGIFDPRYTQVARNPEAYIASTGKRIVFINRKYGQKPTAIVSNQIGHSSPPGYYGTILTTDPYNRDWKEYNMVRVGIGIDELVKRLANYYQCEIIHPPDILLPSRIF